MKKIISLVCIGIISLASLIVGIVALNKDNKGERGKSAYDLAVEQGYTGSQIEWMLSLDGVDGADGDDITIEEIYQAATEYGYTGEFLDFLNEYLTISNEKNKYVINDNLLSVVSVYSNFTVEETYMSWGGVQTQQSKTTSAGAGVIYKMNKEEGDAYIITNYHVVYESTSITEDGISDDIYINLYGGEKTGSGKISVTYVGGTMNYDIAVLKIEDSEVLKQSNAKAVTVNASSNLSVGEAVTAIGNPEALGISATSGIVSVDSEYITMTAADDVTSVTFRVIRVDAAINSGNSGGGLFDGEGKLIGIVNASTSSSIENISFAIPTSIAIGAADNIIDNFEINKAFLGISSTIDSSKAIINDLGLTKIEEVVSVTEIEENSAAYSKIEVGDIIKTITYNSITYDITRQYMISDLLFNVRENDTITISVIRNNVLTDIDITFTSSNFNIIG